MVQRAVNTIGIEKAFAGCIPLVLTALGVVIYFASMDGSELRRRRERLRMTQEQLARELGVAPNTVARWERGERSIPPHLALALNALESKKK